jgi:hypothetical protein
MSPAVSLVVVSWESREDLEGLIASMIDNLPTDGSVELIVVDNASSIDPTDTVDRWSGPAQVERLGENLGFGVASNRGVELANAPITVLCNPDVRLVDDSILRLAVFSAERRAIVGPRLLWNDGTLQPSASGPVVGIWPWIGALIPGAIQPGWMLARTEPWRRDESTKVTWLTGAVIAAPTEILERLGPFDEDIELMSEDLDLGLRAQHSGVTCIFAPDVATVIHIGGTSTRKRFDDGGRSISATNRERVIRRTYGSRSARLGTAALVARLRLRVAAKTALGRDSNAERAELQALKLASVAPDRI